MGSHKKPYRLPIWWRISQWMDDFKAKTAPRDPQILFGKDGERGQVQPEKTLVRDSHSGFHGHSGHCYGPDDERCQPREDAALARMAAEEVTKVTPPGEYVEARVGERIRMRTGFSEAVTHLRIDDTMMEAQILPDGVQFFDAQYADSAGKSYRAFSAPLTYAEAGVVEINGRLWYRNK